MRISRVELKDGQIALDITDCEPNMPTDERQKALTEAYDKFVAAALALLELPGDFGSHEARSNKGMECTLFMRYRRPLDTTSGESNKQHMQLDLFIAPKKEADV